MNELTSGEIYFRQLEKAVAFLTSRVKSKPKLALAFGSGLGDLVDVLEDKTVISTLEVPHFPISTAHGHAGNLVFGKLGGKDVLAFEGRTHTYEGYSAAQVAFGSLVAVHLGVTTFVLTNAAGSLNPAFRPGHLMVLTNHISLFCPDPGTGLEYPELGPRFYDQTDPYDMALVEKVIQIGRDAGATMQRGTYVFVPGPRYESRADIQLLHQLGADVVGMSTVPEVLALKRRGIEKIIGISSITNMGAGISTARITHEEVQEQQKQVMPQLKSLLAKLAGEIA